MKLSCELCRPGGIKLGYNAIDQIKGSGKAQKLVDQRSESEANEALLQVHRVPRSDVVGANILQVVEFQLQLAYSHVLGGQLLLQPPQLVLLPEEHPQELREDNYRYINSPLCSRMIRHDFINRCMDSSDFKKH